MKSIYRVLGSCAASKPTAKDVAKLSMPLIYGATISDIVGLLKPRLVVVSMDPATFIACRNSRSAGFIFISYLLIKYTEKSE